MYQHHQSQLGALDARAFAIHPTTSQANVAIREGRRDWVLRFGRCEVRAAHREVLVDGRAKALQPRPFDLLVYLIENRERVVTTDELLDHVWRDEVVQPGSVAAAVLRVRKAVGDSEVGIGQVIRTYQRVGYRFVAALERAATAS
jgi:DNA-binding winged helix-turn-helix (wHTH) protein